MRCAGWSHRARPGASCRATSRPGRGRISNPALDGCPLLRGDGARPARAVARGCPGREPQPTAVILDGASCSQPESGHRAGYDGHKHRKGSKIHAAVDTLGHLLALVVTPGQRDERAQVGALAEEVQAVTGHTVEVAFVDQGYTGRRGPAAAAAEHGIDLEVVKLEEAKRGFVLLPRRWVVERSFAWNARFRRLARDYERLPQVLAGLHFLAFACLMLHQVIHLDSSP